VGSVLQCSRLRGAYSEAAPLGPRSAVPFPGRSRGTVRCAAVACAGAGMVRGNEFEAARRSFRVGPAGCPRRRAVMVKRHIQ